MRVDNLGAKGGWDKLQWGATLSNAMEWSDSDVWAVLWELRQEHSSMRENIEMGHVNSHVEGRCADRSMWTFEEWGNDRADHGTKKEYERERGVLPSRELRAWMGEECRWVVIKGEMVTGEVIKVVRRAAREKLWLDYIQKKETKKLEEGVVTLDSQFSDRQM